MRLFFTWLIFLLHTTVYAGSYSDFADRTYRQYGNTLTFQVFSPTYPLEWQTPARLLFSIVKNKYYFPANIMVIGHISTEINCKIGDHHEREFIAQGPKDLMGYKKIIMDGYGFSVLNRPGANSDIPLVTIDGELDDEKTDYQLFDEAMNSNYFGTLTVGIDEKNCSEVLAYVREYKQKAAGGNRYGFGADPAKFEGAGCAPMAEAIMAKAHLTDLIQTFERTVYVPKTLVGNPEKNIVVSLWNLIFTSTPDMTIPDQNAVKFSFPDPEMIFNYIKKLEPNDKIEKGLFPGTTSAWVVVK
ncbi:MAG: hypothetical protein ACXWQQ_13930 [Pseudobdellovibrio sp.]